MQIARKGFDMTMFRKFISKDRFSGLVAIFTLTVFIAIAFRFIFQDDHSGCHSTLIEGHYLNPPAENRTHLIQMVWQPPTCTLHIYSSNDVSNCLREKRLLFVGDSLVRQVFWAMGKLLDEDFIPSDGSKHEDRVHSHSGVKLEFVWDPYLNGTKLKDELQKYDTSRVDTEDEKPAIFLVGGGLWHAQNVKPDPMSDWKNMINAITQSIRSNKKSSTYLPGNDLLAIAPVPVPLFSRLSPEKSEKINETELIAMNRHLKRLNRDQGIPILFAYELMTLGLPQAITDDGIHVVESVALLRAQILLNLKCNAQISALKRYPNNGTCCMPYKPPSWQQFFLLTFVLAVLPLWLFFSSDGQFYDNSVALSIFGLCLVFCYSADRTHIFQKFHKHFSFSGFVLFTAITFLAGLLTLKRSPPSCSGFLNRDQTEEWKGWMQSLILIYHYTGASQILPIYVVIRLLVASYLFMTGYGHTIYFLKKEDYSFVRFASVLLRLNLLSVILPYMMNTDYSFYYFTPLTTYWFCIVWLTLRIRAESNYNFHFILIKIGLSCVLSSTFIKTPGILEISASTLKVLTRAEWDVAEWRFRMALDCFIVYVGMFLGIYTFSMQSGRIKLSQTLRKRCIVASVLLLPTYIYIAVHSHGKQSYNAWHPILSPFPILAFIALRNANPTLRATHSRAFSWLGKISLETFTLQFHIWLAGDTHVLLNLGLFNVANTTNGVSWGWWGNAIFITIVFLYVCWLVSGAIVVLVAWILGENGSAAKPAAEKSKPLEHIRSELPKGLPIPNKPASAAEMDGNDADERESDEIGKGLLVRWFGLDFHDKKVRVGMFIVILWWTNLFQAR